MIASVLRGTTRGLACGLLIAAGVAGCPTNPITPSNPPSDADIASACTNLVKLGCMPSQIVCVIGLTNLEISGEGSPPSVPCLIGATTKAAVVACATSQQGVSIPCP